MSQLLRSLAAVPLVFAFALASCSSVDAVAPVNDGAAIVQARAQTAAILGAAPSDELVAHLARFTRSVPPETRGAAQRQLLEVLRSGDHFVVDGTEQQKQEFARLFDAFARDAARSSRPAVR